MKPFTFVAPPLLFFTPTSTLSAIGCGGVLHVSVVEFSTSTLVAALPPMVTVVSTLLVKYCPVMVIGVPPDMRPTLGLMVVIFGGLL